MLQLDRVTLINMGRHKKFICKRCDTEERMANSSYCYECRKQIGRDLYHKKWDNIPNAPMGGALNLVGKRFGRLTVIKKLPKTSQYVRWLCQCECGGSKETITNMLTSGNCQSCGCLQKERASEAATTHGLSHKILEYGIWNTIKNRCTNSNVKNYHNYGGRGISVCDRWLNSFENFIEDMGFRPSAKHSIERLNTDGDYTPENCIWATDEMQSRNKRNNIKITINGVTKLMADWAKEYNVEEKLVRSRKATGWKLDETIFTIPKNGHRRD